jgi:2-polyprenyl-6-methoxyphenol hydroxylase-like FAD-dependent oxidoreductase
VRACAIALARNPHLHQIVCRYRRITPGTVDIGLSQAGQTTYAPVVVHDVEYLYSDSIAGIRDDREGFTVSFERGEPRTFDLVVGADGVHSNVRALLFDEESRFVHDMGGYHVATFTVPNRWNLDRWDLFYMVPGKTLNVSSVREGRQGHGGVRLHRARPYLRPPRRGDDQEGGGRAVREPGLGGPVAARRDALGQDAIKTMILRRPWQIWLLMLVLRLIPYMPWKGLLSQRMKTVVHRVATAIDLRDYGNDAPPSPSG